MGFIDAAPREQVHTVATLAGRATLGSTSWPKARVYLLEDRQAVLIVPDPDNRGKVVRIPFDVTTSTWDAREKSLVMLTQDGELAVDGKGCGCGMGAVGSAGPVEGRHDLIRVRAPEWHVVL